MTARETPDQSLPSQARVWEMSAARADEMRATGLKTRYFFPHELRFLPRPGSDGFKVAQRMYCLREPGAGVELILHAAPSLWREFPEELFFDRDIIWHQQHLGLPGHVAVAALTLVGDRLYTTVRFSDLVQRISRRRALKTRIESVFRGWDYMLLNGILHFAQQQGVREVWFPDADLALENTDRRRNPQRGLFERVYQSHLERWRPHRSGRAWVVDVRAVGHRIVAPQLREEACSLGPTVCICHDTERGYGFRGIDEEFADRADRDAPPVLEVLLNMEARARVRTTYSIVGCFLSEIRAAVEAGGHSVAFHSYDHTREGDQLRRCREVDYRIPGYRAPQSRLTDALAEEHLAFHNFEWLASSRSSFGFALPRVERGVAKLPIRTDDHPMHTGALGYPAWEAQILAAVQESLASSPPYLAFGLHDCYAPHWLDRYPELLARLADTATLRTLDEVANWLMRSAAI